MVHKQLVRYALQAVEHEKKITVFPALRDAVHDFILDELNEQLRVTKDQVETLLEMEYFRINVNHPDFVGANKLRAMIVQAEVPEL